MSAKRPATPPAQEASKRAKTQATDAIAQPDHQLFFQGRQLLSPRSLSPSQKQQQQEDTTPHQQQQQQQPQQQPHQAQQDDSDTSPQPSNAPNLVFKRYDRGRLIWTDELHARFLEAVHFLGVDTAKPQSIHRMMNIDGITTEHVKSHLQKFRANLRSAQQGTLGPRGMKRLLSTTQSKPTSTKSTPPTSQQVASESRNAATATVSTVTSTNHSAGEPQHAQQLQQSQWFEGRANEIEGAGMDVAASLQAHVAEALQGLPDTDSFLCTPEETTTRLITSQSEPCLQYLINQSLSQPQFSATSLTPPHTFETHEHIDNHSHNQHTNTHHNNNNSHNQHTNTHHNNNNSHNHSNNHNNSNNNNIPFTQSSTDYFSTLPAHSQVQPQQTAANFSANPFAGSDAFVMPSTTIPHNYSTPVLSTVFKSPANHPQQASFASAVSNPSGDQGANSGGGFFSALAPSFALAMGTSNEFSSSSTNAFSPAAKSEMQQNKGASTAKQMNMNRTFSSSSSISTSNPATVSQNQARLCAIARTLAAKTLEMHCLLVEFASVMSTEQQQVQQGGTSTVAAFGSLLPQLTTLTNAVGQLASDPALESDGGNMRLSLDADRSTSSPRANGNGAHNPNRL